MKTLNNKKSLLSNSDVEWSKHYDYYELEMRELYKITAIPQNESHFELLKWKAKNYLTKDNIFCEIGFGGGLTLRMASKYFRKIVGLDISPKNIEITEKELLSEGLTNIILYESNLMRFDPKFENQFNVISFIHGLEHFSDDDYPVILNNIKKYLKKDGIFTGALPFKNYLNFRMCPNCSHIFEIDGHITSHDIESLKKVFISNGFKIVYINNVNFQYLWKNSSFLKKIYIYYLYKIKKHKSASQLEFIVLNNQDDN